ncbi:MAG: hypothetical protein J5I93_09465 [Pirellulaceae bacterium]|nr:hypothetical protein [Pirellulaceae bacterium]
MYFHESEAIARENRDLQATMERVDEMLATIFTAAPLRPADFACRLACDANQVVAIFDLLADQDVLLAQEMVECERCQNLMLASELREAWDDGDDFDCSSCGRILRRRAPVIRIYRMTAETLARPKPAVPTADIEQALRELDQHSSVFRRLGQIWVIKYEREMILMQDARGLAYLARLLADAGHDVPAVSLLAVVAGIDPRITSGTSGSLLDDQAMAKYKQRYSELQEELEEAESSNDLGGIAKVQAELEAFGTEIARATGLGGKKRERTDAEKVRKAVSMAVSRAIDSIRNEHAILGRHLQNSISSGLTFRYDPERDPSWLTPR